jgi:hypothetical protein
VRFAERPPTSGKSYAFGVCAYELPVGCYPGQGPWFEGKLRNLALALRAFDSVVIRPGETLSFWRCVGRPSRDAGYASAAAIRGGELVADIGGSICLVSTVMYNIGLVSGLTVTERYCHSVDTYGEGRYFELGRDAAVEYPYRDLRMRNDGAAAVLIRTFMSHAGVRAEALSERDDGVRVEIRTSTGVGDGDGGFSVEAERLITRNGVDERQALPCSRYDSSDIT